MLISISLQALANWVKTFHTCYKALKTYIYRGKFRTSSLSTLKVMVKEKSMQTIELEEEVKIPEPVQDPEFNGEEGK